ncbi:TPA: tail fiber assembly protein [Citrobacter werkmanii]
MKKFENFVLTQPDQKVTATIGGEEKTVLFLKSGDGLCWYEARREFSDDTVKIQYDSAGIIRSVVDKPVPERGNVYAASMLWPINASVAEIAVEDYPAELTLDGTWRFDGESVIRDADLVAGRNLRLNTRKFNRLLRACTDAAFPLQSALALGIITPEQQSMLTELQNYAVTLADTDLTATPVIWPTPPVSVKLPL